MQNVGIYSSLGVLVLVHGGIWGGVRPSIDQDKDDLVQEAESLEMEVTQMSAQSTKFKEEIEKCRQILGDREKELESYGEFLPSIKEKNSSIQAILSLIEELKLTIEKQEFEDAKASGAAGSYYTYDFTLQLRGAYQNFKLMLNKIQQTTMIIRIEKFEVIDYGVGNDAYHWKAMVNFRTYFSR